MFMTIRGMGVSVFNIPCALTLSTSLCIYSWGESSGWFTHLEKNRTGHVWERQVYCGVREEEESPGKVWENPWSSEYVHSVVAAHLQVLSSSSGKASLPGAPEQPVPSCLPWASARNWNLYVPHPGLCWDFNGSWRSIAAFY